MFKRISTYAIRNASKEASKAYNIGLFSTPELILRYVHTTPEIESSSNQASSLIFDKQN